MIGHCAEVEASTYNEHTVTNMTKSTLGDWKVFCFKNIFMTLNDKIFFP